MKRSSRRCILKDSATAVAGGHIFLAPRVLKNEGSPVPSLKLTRTLAAGIGTDLVGGQVVKYLYGIVLELLSIDSG